METTDRIQLASRFINSTHSHIFLTGKAGTGKTTFLRALRQQTHKHFVVVAPTGIAALNAEGVTIHSQFLLPLGSFVPDPNYPLVEGPFFNRRQLSRKHALNMARKKVLRSIDLLVIDEVSMLRADVLDAIDSRLRSARGRYYEPFGGVQLLLIGDLYQLPPVVKDHEWSVLSTFYESPHFFASKALKDQGVVYLELDKIFRQEDRQFIDLLNHLRNNILTQEDLDLLNTFYQPGRQVDAEEEVITLTTHNYRADRINEKALGQLDSPVYHYSADVEGDFPRSMYPAAETLSLKVGAQVMFIRNDSTGMGRYFNGKLATVTHLDHDAIEVRLAGTREKLTLEKERWENKKYTVDEQSQELSEKVIGAYEQYPLKLAWAITVHKSQGLTFDKAIIDVGSAFAPGQVYVALSRLRTIDGLILRTPIHEDALSSDDDIVRFTAHGNAQPPLTQQLSQQQAKYLRQLCEKTFDFAPIINALAPLIKEEDTQMEFEDASMQEALPQLADRYAQQVQVTQKFRRQLMALLQQQAYKMLLERIQKGSAYYKVFLASNIKALLAHMAEVSHLRRVKTYLNRLEEIDQLQVQQLESIEKLALLASHIIDDAPIDEAHKLKEKGKQRRLSWWQEAMASAAPRKSKRKTGRKRKRGETYEVTYGMIKEGKTISTIAEERGMAVSTIYGHVARGIRAGAITIEEALPTDSIARIISKVKPHVDKTTKEIHDALDGQLSYHEIRVGVAYWEWMATQENA